MQVEKFIQVLKKHFKISEITSHNNLSTITQLLTIQIESATLLDLVVFDHSIDNFSNNLQLH